MKNDKTVGINELLAHLSDVPHDIKERGSLRLVSEPQLAERVVPSTQKSREYPCQFDWEITDNRLESRFKERMGKNELTEAQVQWYMSRLKFRNLV